MRATESDEIITTDMVDSNGRVKCMVHQSSYQYGGIRSAINHVYIFSGVKILERMKRELSTCIAGMERTVIEEKQMLGLKICKGNNPSASRHKRSLRRHYLNVEERGIF